MLRDRALENCGGRIFAVGIESWWKCDASSQTPQRASCRRAVRLTLGLEPAVAREA